MVDGIGGGGAVAREAILAAMKSQAKASSEVRGSADAILDQTTSADSSDATRFVEKLKDHLLEIDSEAKGVNRMPEGLVTGKIENFHEIAVQIKQAEFKLRFALEIRNKLIDAYREVMRMNV